MSKISLRLLSHSPSAATETLLSSLVSGCEYGFEQAKMGDEDDSEPLLYCASPLKCDSSFATNCSGILLFTPENFGYMSGALKDWFDRSFYDLENTTRGLPYALCVRAGKDGTGAIRSVQSIAKGLGWKAALEPIIVKGTVCNDEIHRTKEFAATFAAGVCLGVY